MSKTRISQIGRVSYPSVFTPREPMDGQGKAKYQLTLLWDKSTDLSDLKNAIEACIAAKWQKRPKDLKLPIRDGDEKNEDGTSPEYAGKVYAQFKAEVSRPPQVIAADKSKIEEIDGTFYAGCHARVSYSVYAWQNPMGGKGVSLSLGNVQKTADDESFDGRTSADADFDALEVTADDLF
jgi:hypothetical protein